MSEGDENGEEGEFCEEHGGWIALFVLVFSAGLDNYIANVPKFVREDGAQRSWYIYPRTSSQTAWKHSRIY